MGKYSNPAYNSANEQRINSDIGRGKTDLLDGMSIIENNMPQFTVQHGTYVTEQDMTHSTTPPYYIFNSRIIFPDRFGKHTGYEALKRHHGTVLIKA